jgi:peroxiredoxin
VRFDPYPIPWAARQDDPDSALHFRSWTSTREDGTFVLERVPPGEGRLGRMVTLSRAGDGFRELQFAGHVYVEVLSGQTVQTTIGEEGSSVIGRLLPPEGWSGPVDWTHAAVTIQKLVPLPRESPPTPEKDEEWLQWYREWWPSENGKAHRRAEWQSWANPTSTGSFRVEGVPEGDFRLTASIRDAPCTFNGMGVAGKPIASLTREFHIGKTERDRPMDFGAFVLSAIHRLEPGSPAPPFTVRTRADLEWRLDAHRGKYVLVVFWASSCTPCQVDVPHWLALHRTFGKNPRFAMIGLSIDSNAEAWGTFLDSESLEWPQARIDPEGEVAKLYFVNSMPTAFLIAPDGKLVATHLGGSRLVESVRSILEAEGK